MSRVILLQKVTKQEALKTVIDKSLIPTFGTKLRTMIKSKVGIKIITFVARSILTFNDVCLYTLGTVRVIVVFILVCQLN